MTPANRMIHDDGDMRAITGMDARTTLQARADESARRFAETLAKLNNEQETAKYERNLRRLQGLEG